MQTFLTWADLEMLDRNHQFIRCSITEQSLGLLSIRIPLSILHNYPVVTHDSGAKRELIAPNCLESIPGHIIKLIEDNMARRSQSEDARDAASHESPDVTNADMAPRLLREYI